MRSYSKWLLPLLLVLGIPAFCGPLLNVPITGTLNFGGYAENWFDPANGYVPAGAPNASGPTVTIASPGIAFQYLDGFSGLDVSFLSDLSFSVSQFPVGAGGGANNWSILLSGLSPEVAGLVRIGNTFPNLSESFTATSVTLTFGGGTLNPPGWSATYQLTSIPEPGTFLLLASGLALLALRRPRR